MKSCIQVVEPVQQRDVCYRQQRSGPSKTFGTKVSDIGHEATGFDVFPDGFQPCFAPVFSYYVPIPLLCNGNVYSMPLYVEVYNLFFFVVTEGYN